MFTRIVRFSDYGFIPQYQKYHMTIVEYYLSGIYTKDIDSYPSHLLSYIKRNSEKHEQFFKMHEQSLRNGIWCFVGDNIDLIALNHLDKIPQKWEGYIDSNTVVFDVNWEYTSKLSDKDKGIEVLGCYIPEVSLTTLCRIRRIG